MTADLEFWEYSGSLRWSFTTGRIQPFLTAGYGLTWYRLANVSAFGHLVDGRWGAKLVLKLTSRRPKP